MLIGSSSMIAIFAAAASTAVVAGDERVRRHGLRRVMFGGRRLAMQGIVSPDQPQLVRPAAAQSGRRGDCSEIRSAGPGWDADLVELLFLGRAVPSCRAGSVNASKPAVPPEPLSQWAS